MLKVLIVVVLLIGGSSIYIDDGCNQNKSLIYNKIIMKIREKTLPSNSLKIADSYYDIGYAYYNLHKNDIAISYYNKSLKIRLEVLGENSQEVAFLYNNLSISYEDLGEYEKSIAYQLKAIDIKEKLQAIDYSSLSISYINIAKGYEELGKYEKSLKYSNKALDIRKKYFQNDCNFLIEPYNSIALTYHYMDENFNALKYLKEAKPIIDNICKDISVARSIYYNNMGLCNEDNETKELEYFLKSLEIEKKIYDENRSEELAVAYNNVATSFANKGDFNKSIAYLYNSIKIYQNNYGEKSLFLGVMYNNLGTKYRDIDDNENAKKYFIKSIKTLENISLNQHPFLAIFYQNLGGIYEKDKIYQDAMNAYNKALEIRKVALKADDEKIKNTQEMISNLSETIDNELYTDDTIWHGKIGDENIYIYFACDPRVKYNKKYNSCLNSLYFYKNKLQDIHINQTLDPTNKYKFKFGLQYNQDYNATFDELFQLNYHDKILSGIWTNKQGITKNVELKMDDKIDIDEDLYDYFYDFRKNYLTYKKEQKIENFKSLNKSLVWKEESHSKVLMFRLKDGFDETVKERLNKIYDKEHTVYAVTYLTCSYRNSYGSSVKSSNKITYLSNDLLSYSHYLYHECGAHPDFYTSHTLYDLHNAKIYKLEDLIVFSKKMPKNTKEYNEKWNDYEFNIQAKKLRELAFKAAGLKLKPQKYKDYDPYDLTYWQHIDWAYERDGVRIYLSFSSDQRAFRGDSYLIPFDLLQEYKNSSFEYKFKNENACYMAKD